MRARAGRPNLELMRHAVTFPLYVEVDDVVIERDSGGNFVASVPALPGCHTQANSLDELQARIREAIELCLEVRGWRIGNAKLP